MAARNRTAVKRRVVAIGIHAMADERDGRGRPVKVTYTYPGETVSDSTLYLGEMFGRSDPDTIGRGERLSTDLFTINAQIWTFGHPTAEAAEAEAERLMNVFDADLRSGNRLAQIAGLDDGDDVAIYTTCRSAEVGEVTGPWHASPPGNLFAGSVLFTIDCASDI